MSKFFLIILLSISLACNIFADLKPCANILNLRKFRSSSCAMTKMAAKRTGVVEKHCSAFALLKKTCIYKLTKFQ